MWRDPIVEDVRAIRNAYRSDERFDYDLDAIYHDLKEREAESGRKFVSVPQNASRI
jgi:hypothetical protein